MSKVAVITDIHFDCRGGSQYFLERYELFFKNIFFPHLIENKIKVVLNLGDTWENRKYVNTYSMQKAREMFFDKLQELDIEVISILGNHDVAYRNTNMTNSMDIIKLAYSNVKVVYEYEELEVYGTKFGLMSWINNENLQRNLERLKKSDVDIMCCHAEIIGCEMTKGNFAEHGLERNVFSRFKEVWSGHFHIKGKYENVNYLGNPFQTNWDDFGSERGFHVYDTTTKELSFIRNTYDTYALIEYNNELSNDTFDFEQYKDQIVKVITPKLSTLVQSDYLTFVEKLKEVVKDYSMIEDNDSSDMELPNEVKLMSKSEMINEYVESLSIKDESEVKSIMHSLYAEALNNTVV